jgi:hypothetical protein
MVPIDAKKGRKTGRDRGHLMALAPPVMPGSDDELSLKQVPALLTKLLTKMLPLASNCRGAYRAISEG